MYPRLPPAHSHGGSTRDGSHPSLVIPPLRRKRGMESVPGRGSPRGSPPPRCPTHGKLQSRARTFQAFGEHELRARLAHSEADRDRLRHTIAAGTEQYQRTLQELDCWRRETLARRASHVPPPPTGEHRPPEGALVTAQAEIIKLTQQLATSEAATLSAENLRIASDQAHAITTRNHYTVSLDLHRARADLQAERRSHDLTKQLLVTAVSAQTTHRSVTATLSAVNERLLQPAPHSAPPPRARLPPSTSPGPSATNLLAMLAASRPAAAVEPRPVPSVPSPRTGDGTPFIVSPVYGRSPVPISSPVLGSAPSSLATSGAGSKPGSPDT